MTFDLPIDIQDDDLATVVDAVTRAGRIAARSYNTADLWDTHVLSNVLWKLVWNHVEAAAEEAGIRHYYEHNSLRIQLGKYRCGVYSLGETGSTDPWDYDFLRTAKRRQAGQANGERLFDISLVENDLPGIAGLVDLHLVFCPGLPNGVQAVHLGAPTETAGVGTWAWVRTLYRFGGAVGDDGFGAPSAPEPPRGPYPDYGERADQDPFGLKPRARPSDDEAEGAAE